MYIVINFRTGAFMGRYKTRVSARRRADKVDLEYGAITASVRFLPI